MCCVRPWPTNGSACWTMATSCWRTGPSNTDVRASVRWALLGRPDAPKLRPRRACVPALRPFDCAQGRPEPRRGAAAGSGWSPSSRSDRSSSASSGTSGYLQSGPPPGPPARRLASTRAPPPDGWPAPGQRAAASGDSHPRRPCNRGAVPPEVCADARIAAARPLRGRLAPDPCLPAAPHRSSLPCVWGGLCRGGPPTRCLGGPTTPVRLTPVARPH